MSAWPDWLATPAAWILLLIVSHVIMLVVFVRTLREDIRREGMDEGWNAAREAQREARCRKQLPLLDPEPDPERLLP